MKNVIAFLFSLFISVAGYLLVARFEGSGYFDFNIKDFDITDNRNIRGISLFVVMCIGIFSKVLHDILKEKENRRERFKLKDVHFAFQRAAFVRALLVSPLVFYVIYDISQSAPDNVAAYLIAYQNGFFWQAVFEKNQLE